MKPKCGEGQPLPTKVVYGERPVTANGTAVMLALREMIDHFADKPDATLLEKSEWTRNRADEIMRQVRGE